jgi:hypothetical protein
MEAESIPIEIRRMISRFGAAATVAGMLTPDAPCPHAAQGGTPLIFRVKTAPVHLSKTRVGVTV